MNIPWGNGSQIAVKIQNDQILISANQEGLLSIAKQLSLLAKQARGSHIHYDTYNSLEDGSVDLIIEKI